MCWNFKHTTCVTVFRTFWNFQHAFLQFSEHSEIFNMLFYSFQNILKFSTCFFTVFRTCSKFQHAFFIVFNTLFNMLSTCITDFNMLWNSPMLWNIVLKTISKISRHAENHVKNFKACWNIVFKMRYRFQHVLKFSFQHALQISEHSEIFKMLFQDFFNTFQT